jgi:hypothetical protein
MGPLVLNGLLLEKGGEKVEFFNMAKQSRFIQNTVMK